MARRCARSPARFPWLRTSSKALTLTVCCACHLSKACNTWPHTHTTFRSCNLIPHEAPPCCCHHRQSVMYVDDSSNQDLAREARATTSTTLHFASFLARLSLLMLEYTDSICMPSNNMHAGWGVVIIAIVRGVPATLLATWLWIWLCKIE